MFETTTADSVSTAVRISFWQSVKAGIGFSLGAVLMPAIAVVIQTFTKIPLATMLTVLRIIH